MNTESFVLCDNLVKIYKVADLEVVALQGLDLEVHPGEVTEINYYATNTADSAVTGQAVPSVAPGQAAKYFSKTECFCFTRQLLEPGEGKEMPLRFVVDPALPEN